MSIGTFFKNLFGSATVKSIETFALTETQKAVAALAKSAIGQNIAADIAALTSSSLTGPEKFEQVVSTTLPMLANMLSASGRQTALSEVEDIGRALVQTIFNDTKSTKAASIAMLISLIESNDMLTNAAVKAARPRSRAYKMFDERGLHLHVAPSGRAT